MSPKIHNVPLPYTTFLLASSWTTDYGNPLEPYASGISFLPADMESSQGGQFLNNFLTPTAVELISILDNNDGITILDITTPENLSYCFISRHDLRQAEGKVPLSAEGYVREYYPVSSDEDEENEYTGSDNEEFLLKNIADLNGDSLVTLEMLADAWPAEYEKSHENSQKIKPDCLDASEESAPTVIPSLAELSLKPAVEEALWTNQTTEIEELLWMSHKTELIKANKIIDFSHFSLFPEGIVSMVSQFEAVEGTPCSSMFTTSRSFEYLPTRTFVICF